MRFDDRNNADFLTEEGQLRYDLNVEVEEFKFFGVNTNVLLCNNIEPTTLLQAAWNSAPPRTVGSSS